jgi:hypothetical protein
MTSNSDYPLIMSGMTVLCGLGFVGSIWPAAERVISAVVVAVLVGAVVAAAVAGVVREIAIRRKLRQIVPIEPTSVRRPAERQEVQV